MATRTSPITADATPTGHQTAIATRDGLHLLTATGDDHLFRRRAVTAVAGDGEAIWVLTDGSDLHRLDDDGTTHVARLDHGVGTCLRVPDGSIWIGGDDARLWRVDGSTIEEVASFLHAPTREKWSTPWGGPPSVFSIDTHGPDLYVSVHVGGILRTSDDGGSWSPTIEIDDDVHQVAVDPNGTVWAATGRRGLAQSDDRGQTWRYHTSGLHATYLLAVAAGASDVLVAASSGHAAGDGVLYRFDGLAFTPCPLDSGDRLDGAIGPRQIAGVGDSFVVASPNGGVHTSRDGGRSWTRILHGVRGVNEVAMLAGEPMTGGRA